MFQIIYALTPVIIKYYVNMMLVLDKQKQQNLLKQKKKITHSFSTKFTKNETIAV